MKRSIIHVILFLLITPFLAQSSDHIPAVHDYQPLDQQARVLNFERIKRKIRVPVSALKEKRILNIHCRILVNEHGSYVRHIFTRIDHEDLLGPVSIQVANLVFIPARKNYENVPSWVNIVFRFAPKEEALQPSSSCRESFFSGFRRRQLSAETTDLLQSNLEEGMWEDALALSSVLIEDHGKRLARNNPEQLIELYTSRAMAFLGLGLPESGHIDLNKAMGLQAESGVSDLPPNIHALRILSGMATNHHDTQVEDFRLVESYMDREEQWNLWFPILLSSQFRSTLSEQPSGPVLTHFTAEEINTIVLGLNALDRHDFHAALRWMNQATRFGLPQSFNRELSFRIAEALRQTGQQAEALNICEELLESQPLDPFTYYVKGIILLDIGATAEGNEALQKSILLGLDAENRSKVISLLHP